MVSNINLRAKITKNSSNKHLLVQVARYYLVVGMNCGFSGALPL